MREKMMEAGREKKDDEMKRAVSLRNERREVVDFMDNGS